MTTFGDVIQQLMFLSVLVGSIVISVFLIRFRSKMTTAYYYITEGLVVAAFSLQFFYNDVSVFQEMFGSNTDETFIDHIIIGLIAIVSTVIISMLIVESCMACNEMKKKKLNRYKTGIKESKFSKNKESYDERWKNVTTTKLKNDGTKNMEMEDLDNMKPFKEESVVSKNTVSLFDVKKLTNNNHQDEEEKVFNAGATKDNFGTGPNFIMLQRMQMAKRKIVKNDEPQKSKDDNAEIDF